MCGFCGCRLPLNSRQVKTDHLHRLAASLDKAVTVSGDKLCQMINGNLTGDGRETQNIQVILTGGPSSEFFLEDVDGRFLTVQATVEETQSKSSESTEHDPNEELRLEADTLRMELEALTRENHALKRKVSALEQKLSNEKSRFR